MNVKHNKMIYNIAVKGVRKLKSKAGASISFALLLFLICAMVGAVMLTASTAAAGRASKIAEMDQRYFNVTSAGELLINELCGKPVTIVRTKTVESKVVTEYNIRKNADGSETAIPIGDPDKTDSVEFTTKINDKVFKYNEDNGDMSFLTARAVTLLFGEIQLSDDDENVDDESGDDELIFDLDHINRIKLNTQDAFDCSFSGLNKQDSGKFSIAVYDNGMQNILNVVCKYSLNSDGTLNMTLASDADSENDTYALSFTLKPSFNEPESLTATNEDIQVNKKTDDIFTETKTTINTTTKTSTITWSVIDAE